MEIVFRAAFVFAFLWFITRVTGRALLGELSTFALLTIALASLNTRWRTLRPLTHGTPIVVVDQGEPIMANLRAERVSIDDLMAAARNEGIERFADVRLAVLETNGRISFFTATEKSGASEPPSAG